MKFNIYILFLVFVLAGCDDFVKIDAPRTDLVRPTVFENDATADAAMSDVYFSMKSTGFASGDPYSISFIGALLSDELNFSGPTNTVAYNELNDNDVTDTNPVIESLWTSLYTTIYKANAVLEGVSASSTLSADVKARLTGESKFVRALAHFYLVNLWGDVPLIVTTDYRVNNTVTRTPVGEVYAQIIDDLSDAAQLLPADYSLTTNQRIRVNSAAATALLARVYLFTGNWQEAETSATTVIENPLYSLEPLADVFKTTSKEAIFQLWSEQYPNDLVTFYVSGGSGPYYGSITPELEAVFTDDDARRAWWMGSVTYNGNTYYQPLKYKFALPPIYFTTVLRLAEMYLVRAEARAQLNDLTGGTADLNLIRSRASLGDLSALSQQELLDAVLAERQKEFFTEWGHRWLDLNRSGKANEVLDPMKVDWNTEDEFLLIPQVQIINNPAITQNNNPG
jgi:starch-binding outer membrane protein, SusD/RagB family